jgi:hypothetical protein
MCPGGFSGGSGVRRCKADVRRVLRRSPRGLIGAMGGTRRSHSATSPHTSRAGVAGGRRWLRRPAAEIKRRLLPLRARGRQQRRSTHPPSGSWTNHGNGGRRTFSELTNRATDPSCVRCPYRAVVISMTRTFSSTG